MMNINQKIKEMKNILLKITGTFLILMIGATSCMEDPIKEAQEKYDYSQIVPKVLGVNAPAGVVQTQEATLSVTYHRGGSTWAWSAQGATIKSVSPDTRSAIIRFDQTPADLKAKITVVETTYAGKTSDPKTVEVVINPFCVFNVNAFLGVAVCDEEGYGKYNVTFRLDPTNNKRIHNDNFWDYPGPGATIYYDLSGDINQIVTVPKQDFVFGDGSTGWVQGSGTYDTCKKTMTVNYTVNYDGDNYPTKHVFKW